MADPCYPFDWIESLAYRIEASTGLGVLLLPSGTVVHCLRAGDIHDAIALRPSAATPAVMTENGEWIELGLDVAWIELPRG